MVGIKDRNFVPIASLIIARVPLSVLVHVHVPVHVPVPVHVQVPAPSRYPHSSLSLSQSLSKSGSGSNQVSGLFSSIRHRRIYDPLQIIFVYEYVYRFAENGLCRKCSIQRLFSFPYLSFSLTRTHTCIYTHKYTHLSDHP